MTAPDFSVTPDLLQAYADGRLADAERAAVERHLDAHPDARAEIAVWRRQNEALHALFDPIAGEPVPRRLSPHAIAHDLRMSCRQGLRNVAAALILVVLGGMMGWFGRDYLSPSVAASTRLIDAAVTAHNLYTRETGRAVEVAADAPNLMGWLSNRITTTIAAPDLSADGYALLGGRLLPAGPDTALPAAAQLMYENAEARRVTLYLTVAPPDGGGKQDWAFVTRDGVEAYYWADASITCTIVADLPEDQLRDLGQSIFRQLTARPEADW